MGKKEFIKNIANILRRDCLVSTTKAGSGHPTSCLSCAEIIATLFFSEMKYDVKNPLNPDNDEFILSKGHAAPILYSALKNSGAISGDLDTLRKLKSKFEGHPIPKSIDWIKVATGSLGQGLSIATGFALASKIQKRKFRTFVLLGDSEMAEGSNYEAIQFVTKNNLSSIVAIVDANSLGQTGKTAIGDNIEEYKKRFESFGWKSKMINGHDISEILTALNESKKSDKPFAIIAKTIKGKGVSFLENKENWHGKTLSKDQLKKALNEIKINPLKRFKIRKPEKIKIAKSKIISKYEKNDFEIQMSTREALGETLKEIVSKENNFFVIDAEVGNSTKVDKINEIKKDNLIQTYIAEQNQIGLALGLSKKGLNVLASTFSAFLTRSYDQIRMSAISSGNFIINGSHSGVSVGEDGASQMGLEDISMFRTIPNSIIVQPSDGMSTNKLIYEIKGKSGIKYIRTIRENLNNIYSKKEKFPLGDFKILKSSSNDECVIIGTGITVHEALKAYEILKKKVKIAVIDIYSINPLNMEKLGRFIEKHGKRAIIVEDHRKSGGIGELISSELSSKNLKFSLLNVSGIPHSGKPEELRELYRIDHKAIISVI